MPTFTRKLSDLIQQDFDFGLDQYPIFDEVYRETLNDKILKHYWNYEIGQETESMFRFSLNRKMNEVMPYFNQLYKSELLLPEAKALDSANLNEHVATENTNTDTSDSTADNTSTNSGKSRSVTSDTPQVMLSPDEDYASGASDAISESNVSSDATSHATNVGEGSGTIDRTVTGSNGIPLSDLLTRYRQTFMNIDMLVIEELATLFMQIWDNGDEFSQTEGLNYGFGWNFLF